MPPYGPPQCRGTDCPHEVHTLAVGRDVTGEAAFG